MTVSQARVFLGVNKVKMAQLIRERQLPTKTSIYDKRMKLLRRADIEALARELRPPKPEATAA